MRAHAFFSVHEKLYRQMAPELRDRYGVDQFSGFCWGKDQARILAGGDVRWDPLVVFSKAVLPNVTGRPDKDFLRRKEQEYGVSLHRMIFAERHLLEDRSYDQVLRLAEVLIRTVESVYEKTRPDFVFSEDVGGLTSYIHWAAAKSMGIPFWIITSARLPYRISVYVDGLANDWHRTRARFEALKNGDFDDELRREASEFLANFRKKPERPTGMETRARLPVLDAGDRRRYRELFKRYREDPDNPTLDPPWRPPLQRVLRLSRAVLAKTLNMFEEPVLGERYVLYPIHFQPEASTLVQAPYFLNQVSLIEDIAKSLPVGHHLYVKEHVSNRGRRPLSFYRQIRSIPSVRLLGPDVNTWALIQNASAIAVITGTMGWEGLIYRKPVITFGDVFYNDTGLTYRAGLRGKEDWYGVFQAALYHHEHDEDTLLRFISAIQQTSFPGFMKNPLTFPRVLEADNVRNLTDGLATAVGLQPIESA